VPAFRSAFLPDWLVSISPTSLRNVQRHQHRVNNIQDGSLFTIIFAKILLLIVGYGFCTEHHILAHFSKMQLPLRHQTFSAQKLLYFYCSKNVGKIDPLPSYAGCLKAFPQTHL
jgi:hypothetical protein